MNFEEYQEAAVKTAIYNRNYSIIYPVLGLANEAGEVVGKVKKVLRDNDGEFTPEYKEAIKDELGDVLWYIAATARDLDITMNDIAQRNIDKLADRQARNVLGGSGDKR